MKRIAFSILYNCLHHLKHKDFSGKMLENFDLWIIVEGSAGTNGSTAWCKDFHRPSVSNDGTREYLSELKKKHPEKIFIDLPDRMWHSKDTMVNQAIDMIKAQGIEECFLWEVDADEQWEKDQLDRAEASLMNAGGKTGSFLCDYFLAEDLFAQGEWGEGRALPYRRLWNWKGEYFQSHEPPLLKGGNGKEVLIQGVRFNHYAYYFEKDVHFKSQYYGGHEMIYDPWLKLQIKSEREKMKFPLSISYLFGSDNYIGKSKTIITE